MKAAKRKRDPSKEPFASPYTDDEWRTLGGEALSDELVRATRKSQSGREQVKRGESLPYLDPMTSDYSAVATVSAVRTQVSRKVFVVETLRAGQSRSGQNRAKRLKEDAKPKHDSIRALATELLKSKAPRDIVGVIVARGHKETTVRRALRTHPTGHWPGRTKQGATR